MDNSAEYILMCEKAVEIQKLYRCEDVGCWNEGDVYISDNEVYIASVDGESGLPEKEDYEVWLPRQDQLQDMLDYEKNPWLLFELMGQFVQTEYSGFLGSGEQFWLGFVMEQKFNKQWTGKDWRIK